MFRSTLTSFPFPFFLFCCWASLLLHPVTLLLIFILCRQAAYIMLLCFRCGSHTSVPSFWPDSNWWWHGFVYLSEQWSSKTCRHLEKRCWATQLTQHTPYHPHDCNLNWRKDWLSVICNLLFSHSVGSQIIASGSVQVPRFMLLQSGSLQIQPVSIQDSGEFTCIVSNSEGTINTTAALTVWSKTHSQTTKSTINSSGYQTCNISLSTVYMTSCVQSHGWACW